MSTRPSSFIVFVTIGVVVWLAVTAAAVLLILQAPGDNSGLAVGLFLIWVLLIVFAVFSRLTEHVGGGPR